MENSKVELFKFMLLTEDIAIANLEITINNK